MKGLNAYYKATIYDFIKSDNDKILGEISSSDSSAETRIQQKNTWEEEIKILKRELANLDDTNGRVLFEYTIPRMGKRVDSIVLYKNIVFILEFKCGSDEYISGDYDQVYDYALDLKNFHKESSDKLIVPILIATQANPFENNIVIQEGIVKPLKCNELGIKEIISSVSRKYKPKDFSYDDWISSEYLPTPTIVEAAQALYTGHSVREITRNDAGATNIGATTDAINEIINRSKEKQRKSICFVTGVPGAGKTLVGLNLGIQKADAKKGEHAVFLSGNYPLVEVLQEALVRDKIYQMKKLGLKTSKTSERRKTNTFIQIIHKYRDSFVGNDHIPPEHIVIYDEAQRSWNAKKIANFMKTKKGVDNFQHSEPEFLLSTMDRHKDWAVLVCLIGGGQEINDGEAGLPEWFHSLKRYFDHWDVYVSRNLKDEYLMQDQWEEMAEGLRINYVKDLHLSVSLRSFRSPDLAEFVKSTLDIDLERSKDLYQKIKEKYPIKITRDLNEAKKWVREVSMGTQRYGMLASSGGLRLKPEGIFVKNKIDVTNWFLNDKRDVRSCYSLEDVITEFDVQGLEVDYALVAWDADLRMGQGEWEYKRFKGNKWTNINKWEDRQYLKNSYRVLLTRSRQGMVIYIPRGNDEDETRLRKFYDGTYNYLKNIGIDEI